MQPFATLPALPFDPGSAVLSVVAIVALIAVKLALSTAPKGKRRGPKAKSAKPEAGLDALRNCQVRARPIMSREQAALRPILKGIADAHGLNLNAEVSLSAIFHVSHPGKGADARSGFASIRQKYVDFLLTDADEMPVCGVEY